MRDISSFLPDDDDEDEPYAAVADVATALDSDEAAAAAAAAFTTAAAAAAVATTEEADVEVEESGTVDEEGSGSTACPAFLRILSRCIQKIFQDHFIFSSLDSSRFIGHLIRSNSGVTYDPNNHATF